MATPSASPPLPLDPTVLASARRAAELPLCRACFGRLFGRLGHGLTNEDRATQLLAAVGAPKLPEGPCALCWGSFDRWEVWVDRVERAGAGTEWHRFTCGSRWEPEILAHEEAIWVEVGTSWGESARGAFNRELGKRVGARTGAEGVTDAPDVVFLADLSAGRVEVTILPLYLSGRYRKFDRTLPQTRWPCRRCHGRGCEHCQGTGKTYAESVEELVAGPLLEVTGGRTSRFHGMGREDIDARMLGQGRPFVIEVLDPRHRTLNVEAIQEAINRTAAGRIEVARLQHASASDVVRVKEATPEKSYRVGVRGDVPPAKINEVLGLVTGRAIAQRTPTRVAHRRSDRVRHRRVVEVQLVDSAPGRFTLDVRTEAGTYIKEWVEGDGGRTEPNLASLVGVPLSVDFLDVLEVHDTEV
ncbi:MAG: tRNA pseudouridine(54/55) synthase Pus10 [Thermoplasmata archaeon]